MSYFRVLKLLVFALWPASAWAAPMAFDQSFDNIPGLVWGGVAILSTLGGVTAFLLQLEKSLKDPDNKPMPNRIWLSWATQMLCSWSLGLLMFFFGLHFEWSIYLLAIAVMLSSLGGATALQSLSDTWVKRMGEKLP